MEAEPIHIVFFQKCSPLIHSNHTLSLIIITTALVSGHYFLDMMDDLLA